MTMKKIKYMFINFIFHSCMSIFLLTEEFRMKKGIINIYYLSFTIE